MSPLVDPADVAPLDRERAGAVALRVRLAEIRDPHGPAFDAAWDLLSYFADRGELEPRDVLAGFVRDGTVEVADADIVGTYHLVGAWAGEELVAVRDAYVDLDLRGRRCLVSLAHVYVVPAWRRTGLAALLRALPVTLGRRIARARFGHEVPTLVMAEMEPADPARPETVVRLLAYGRSGFRALDPRRLPYSQPELRELPQATHTALPMLGVTRTLHVPGDAVPAELAALFPTLFHATHRLYLPAERVDPSERHALDTLRRTPGPVPLLPLPESADTLDRLRPLVRGAVLPLYPARLRGPDPAHGDPDDELAELRLP